MGRNRSRTGIGTIFQKPVVLNAIPEDIAKIDEQMQTMISNAVRQSMTVTKGRIVDNQFIDLPEYYRRLYGTGESGSFEPNASELRWRQPIPDTIQDESVLRITQEQAYQELQSQLYQRISNLSDSEQQELLDATDSANVVVALGMFGNPKTRLAALRKAKNMQNDAADVTVKSGDHSVRIKFNRSTPYQRIERELPDAYAQNGYEHFVQEVFSRAATITPEGLFATHINNAVAQVGPNAGKQIIMDFGAGVTPPKPSPMVVRYLKRLYRETQEKMQEPSVTLYRAGDVGNPVESWSMFEGVARRFAEEYNPDEQRLVREATIPKEYILFSHITRPRVFQGWGEAEFLVLGSSAKTDLNMRVLR